MNKREWVAVGVLSIQAWSSASAQTTGQVVAELPGYTLGWIDAAQTELQRQGLEVKNYTVAVLDLENYVLVSFSSPNLPAGCRGSCGPFPAFEVEVLKADAKVLRSHFVR